MKNIVVIGGGTGNFVVLRSLNKHNLNISAIVSMADDGGSTGILRDELGVLPPGDVRQCLIALSNSSMLMRKLMSYRFANGGLCGHNFGNIFLSTLEKVTGSFEKAIDEVGKVLFIKGKVLPITTHKVKLKMVLKNDTILNGEKEIYLSKDIKHGYKKIFLDPFPKVNKKAVDEIINADLIIFSPGGFYTSIIPNLLVKGISCALKKTKAKKVFISNLMNRIGQTIGFKVSNYYLEIIKHVGFDMFDYIIVNKQKPGKELIKHYSKEGELIENDINSNKIIKANLLGNLEKKIKGDLFERNLIRHDCKKLSKELMKIVNNI